MESLFQNSVSEFDLNFLDQTTNAIQGNPPTAPFSGSQKRSVNRMKDRLTNFSKAIYKAKGTNKVLLEVQKQLLKTENELQETRNLLFDKNKNYKVICDERSTYFNQASEYSKEIQKLKEQLKQFERKDFDTKLKDNIIRGYSDQMKGLQSEMDNLKKAKKQSEKEASFSLMRANKDKSLLEKKLIKLLNDYVYPKTQKSDKWLQSLFKKYLPNKIHNSNNDLSEKTNEETFENAPISPKHTEEENQEIRKLSVETVVTDCPKRNETALDDVESLSQKSMLHRNTSFDSEFLGSVDTGRGSSLAFSDGEKSFHSPDYYMADSPRCTVPNLCNTPKSDVSTSPIPQETSDIGDSCATDSCQTFLFLSKRDACTSPMPLESLDVATDTADLIHEKYSPKKKSSASSSLEKQFDITNMTCDTNTIQTSTDISRLNIQANAAENDTASNHISTSNKKSLTSPVNLQNNITSDTEKVFNSVNNITNLVKNLTTESPVEGATNHISISRRKSSTTLVKHTITCYTQVPNDITASPIGEFTTISPMDFDDAASNCSSIYSQELDTSKPTDNVMSNNEKVLNETSSISDSVQDLTVISLGDYDECATNPNSISSIEVPKTPTKLRNRTPDTDLKILMRQEKECLELNNSDNFSHDAGTDIEVQTILDKMRLQHRLVTPIPATPPRGTVDDGRSLKLTLDSRKTIIDPKEKLVVRGFSKQLNLLRTRMQDAINPFIESLPQYFEQIPRLLTDSEANEELLRNLLSCSNKSLMSHENTQEQNTSIKSSNKIQAQVANTASMLETTKIKNSMINEHAGGTSEVNMQQGLDSEDLHEIFNKESSSNENKEICKITKEKSRNITVSKAAISHFVPSRNVSVVNIKQSNGCHDGQIEHENTQELISNNNMDIENINNIQAGDVNLNTSSIPSATINNIVDESEGSISGDDAMQQDLESGDLMQTNKNLNKEMSQNTQKTGKNRNCTNLDKVILKMVPKGKIQEKIQQPIKKLQFELIPIITPQSIPKKKVTESDSAASLNDKSVCENAVKVIATSKPRLTKESRVIVEPSTTETINKLVYETKGSISSEDAMQQDSESEHLKQTNDNGNKEIIENKKIYITPQSIPKKKVTESDSAASLNDKSVCENAVKVIATSKPRLTKESRVIVEPSTTETINKLVYETKGSISSEDAMQQDSESEHLKQTNDNGNKEISENKKIYITPQSIPKKKVTESDSAASLNDKSVYENGVKVKATSKPRLTKESRFIVEPSTTETINNMVYETEGSISGEDAMQHDLKSGYIKQTNKNVNEEISQNTQKTRKNIKKQKLNMHTKGKIRGENQQTVKRPKFKPYPSITPQSIPKKKVTESDSAATLNDKSVYENAVKVFAKSKEFRVIVGHCAPKIQMSPQKSARDVDIKLDNNSSETSNGIKNNKNKLLFELENVTEAPPNRIHSKESVVCNETKRGIKKRSKCSDNDLDDDTETLKELQQKLKKSEIATTIGGRRLRSSVSNEKSVLDIFIFGTSDSNESINKNDGNPAKRKSTSVNDQSPIKKAKIIDNSVKLPDTNSYISTGNLRDGDCKPKRKRLSTSTHQSKDIETYQTVVCSSIPKITKSPISNSIQEDRNDSSVFQRTLRSSCVKPNINNGVEKTPIVAPLNTKFSSEKLHSKAEQNRSQQFDNTSVLMSSERRPRKTTQSVLKTSGSNQIESLPPTVSESVYQKNHNSVISYADLNLFQNEKDCDQLQKKEDETVNGANNYLCQMIQKHGITKIKYCATKVLDSVVNEKCEKLETSISGIIKLPPEQRLGAMNCLVAHIRCWDVTHFLPALLKYLRNPQRKLELFKKQSRPPAPPMTSQEQVLLYIVDELQKYNGYTDIVNKILINMEYILFSPNKTPEGFDVVQSMSHFYAVLCHSNHKLSKLRLFILDALYFLNHKSIGLVKQCLEVCMAVLPLGHMGLAKTPLVTSVVYLLHFYKCETNQDQIQDMRNILRQKYNYDMADWNQIRILDFFKTAITELRDIPIERKMLRLALIILAKRNGVKWCYNNIIKNMLQPMIKDKFTSDVAKRFCVSLLGPLIRPFPTIDNSQSENTNNFLLDMLDKENSPKMEEAIIASLITANKNKDRIIRHLLNWNPKDVSREFETIFRDYVRSKPVNMWKSVLSSSQT